MEGTQLKRAASDKDVLTPINSALNKIQRDDCWLQTYLTIDFSGEIRCRLNRKAKNFIKAIEPGLTPELTLYMAKESPYVPDIFDENNQDVRPAAWWKSGAGIGFSDKLATIALSLVTAVGSSRQLVWRQFSTLGMTYGKLRNQLDHEKAGQLAFCYRQLNKNN